MLKMIKYEYRKSLTSLLCMLGGYAMIELYLLISAYVLEDEVHFASAITLLLIAAYISYFLVMIFGVTSYSKELKHKSGYLLFMTPVSSYKILGAKLLTNLINGVIMVAVIAVLFITGFRIGEDKFSIGNVLKFVEELYNEMGGSWSEVIAKILVFIFLFLLVTYMTVVVAYFAISISATILQNKKGKGAIGVLLFFVIIVLVYAVGYQLPTLDFDVSSAFAKDVLDDLPIILWFLAVAVAAYIGSATLLEKKISL